MTEITILDRYKVLASTGSLGTQVKYFYNGFWFKQNTTGSEALSEELVSILLSCSNCSNYVNYERVRINNKIGCRSRNFLKDGESLISLHKLYNIHTHRLIEDDIFAIESVSDRFEYIVGFVKKAVNLDLRRYLSDALTIDMITLNPDRHFRNLFIIHTLEDKYRKAPLFDHGQSLGANFNITSPLLSVQQCEESLSSCTISGNFESQYTACDKQLRIDTKKLDDRLGNVEDCRQKKILLHRLDKYKHLVAKEADS